MRIIKKYSNRRLYDCETSGYVTLGSIKEIIQANQEFKVIDAATGEDVSRNVLLQIILEEEKYGQYLFSAEMLRQMIRFYGHTMQFALREYLEQSLEVIASIQKQFQENPGAYLQKSLIENTELWAKYISYHGAAGQILVDCIKQSNNFIVDLSGAMPVVKHISFDALRLGKGLGNNKK